MYDARFEAAKATDQSGQRGWYFPPASANDPRRRGWYVWLACQLVVCAIPVILIAAIWS